MECEFCQNHEQGDALYEPLEWDGGIGFDYIRNIKYCPLCGRKLNAEDADRKTEPQRTCDNCGTPRDKCVYCIEEDRMWTPKTEPQTNERLKRLQACIDCEHTDMCEWCHTRWSKTEQTERSK